MEKFEELMANEQFVKKMNVAETDDEIKALFKECGIDIPERCDEVLAEEDLENVAGGRYGITLNGMIDFLCGEGTADLTWNGLWVCAVCLYDYCKYGNAYRTYSKAKVKNMSGDLEKRIPKWMKKLNSLGY